jgi:hypothetical protein
MPSYINHVFFVIPDLVCNKNLPGLSPAFYKTHFTSKAKSFFVVKGEKRLVRTLQFTFAGLCLTLLYFAIWLCNLLSNLKGVLYWSEKCGVLQSDAAFCRSYKKLILYAKVKWMDLRQKQTKI